MGVMANRSGGEEAVAWAWQAWRRLALPASSAACLSRMPSMTPSIVAAIDSVRKSFCHFPEAHVRRLTDPVFLRVHAYNYHGDVCRWHQTAYAVPPTRSRAATGRSDDDTSRLLPRCVLTR